MRAFMFACRICAVVFWAFVFVFLCLFAYELWPISVIIPAIAGFSMMAVIGTTAPDREGP